jgi:hypothetical protein
MNAPLPLLAATDDADQLLLLKSMGNTGWSQTSIIFSAIAIVAVLAFGFVYVFRDKFTQRRKHHHFHRHVTGSAAPTPTPPADQDTTPRKKRWRRSRHPHRPLNPTLAQTRGLPPLRGENQPPPPAP